MDKERRERLIHECYSHSTQSLVTEHVDVSKLTPLDIKIQNSPMVKTTIWYPGHISRDSFPAEARVSYLIGKTGKETRVETESIAPHGGTFTVIDN